jgi:hypothetical protein
MLIIKLFNHGARLGDARERAQRTIAREQYRTALTRPVLEFHWPGLGFRVYGFGAQTLNLHFFVFFSCPPYGTVLSCISNDGVGSTCTFCTYMYVLVAGRRRAGRGVVPVVGTNARVLVCFFFSGNRIISMS